jgi:hypothetical protein
MDSDLVIGYNRNDFFYVMADQNNQLPSIEVCESKQPYDDKWKSDCNNSNFNDNSVGCIQKELCKNRDKVNELNKVQHIHNGADQRYLDVNRIYDENYQDTINLGVGIVGILLLITYYK